MKGGRGASAHKLLSLMSPKISQYNYNAEDGKIIDTYIPFALALEMK